MNIFLVSEQGELVLQKGSQLIVEFANGMRLELSESPTPLPPTIPHGLSIRSDCQPPVPLNITPVVACLSGEGVSPFPVCLWTK